MARSIILDFIDKRVTEKIYKKARKQEENLSPDSFTAHYSGSSIIYWFVIFLFFVMGTLCFGFLDKVVMYILGAASISSFFIVLYHISYRCIVDNSGITVIRFWFLRKQVFWQDIKKVEIQEYQLYGEALEKTAIIRNKQNRVIFTCSYDLVGFNLIVKKAKKERKQKH